MQQVQQIDRDAAATAMLRVRGYSVKIKDTHFMVQAFAEYRVALATTVLTDPNISAALNTSMCCNGVHCGCQGATVEQYLRYQMIDRMD